jgi:hypothetical protein
MRRLISAFLCLGLALGTVTATAQFRFRGAADPLVPEKRTGFTFCRLRYAEVRSEELGQGWETDYENADRNLMIRLPQFTKAEVTKTRSGEPAHAVVSLSDPELFGCPFLFASDVGTIGLNSDEIEQLREFLLKGGFLWVDDFWGPTAWRHWVTQIQRVFPEASIVELDMEHPLFSTFYFIEEVPQIPSIQFWRRSGGGTSERGSLSAKPAIHGLTDEDGHLLIVMSHNTDIADGWEREGEDYDFFHLFSPPGYAVGVNVAVWSMTH